VKRTATITVLSLLVVLGAAAPAMAQKDPFKPLVVDEGPVPEQVEPGRVLTGPGAASPAAPAAPAADETDGAGLARTGIEADRWAPLALILLLVGAAVLVLERYRRLA
jgi:hypothetical protein